MEQKTRQIPEILMQRTNKLMSERFLSKKEMAERLNMEYLTFWRKLNGKRGIDVVFLMNVAYVLGTTVAYLLGETDNPSMFPDEGNSNTNLIISTNDPSRKIVSEPGRLSFNNGEVSIDMPDTPENKKWFNSFLSNALNGTSKSERALATA